MNVLIVDDNEAAADLLQELLTLQDHTARCTYTAQQALDAAAAERFDAALIDLDALAAEEQGAKANAKANVA